MGDLNKRRGRVLGMNPIAGGNQVIEADVPMTGMFGYCTTHRVVSLWPTLPSPIITIFISHTPSCQHTAAWQEHLRPEKAVRVFTKQHYLYDGSYHPVDSSEMAFKTATIQAFKKGFMEAGPVLLEPMVLAVIYRLDRHIFCHHPLERLGYLVLISLVLC